MDQNQMTELQRILEQSLISSGEINRLKALLRTRLFECGWADELKIGCGRIIREQGVENIDLRRLVDEITPIGREKVPAEVKKELLHEIQTGVYREVEKLENSGSKLFP